MDSGTATDVAALPRLDSRVIVSALEVALVASSLERLTFIGESVRELESVSE